MATLRNADSWGKSCWPDPVASLDIVLLEPCPLCLLLRLRLKGQLYPQRPLRDAQTWQKRLGGSPLPHPTSDLAR